MKPFNIVVPLNDKDILKLAITIEVYSPEICVAIGRFNYAHLLHDSLKKLVKEMEPLNLITQSPDYREAVELLNVLEHL